MVTDAAAQHLGGAASVRALVWVASDLRACRLAPREDDAAARSLDEVIPAVAVIRLGEHRTPLVDGRRVPPF